MYPDQGVRKASSSTISKPQRYFVLPRIELPNAATVPHLRPIAADSRAQTGAGSRIAGTGCGAITGGIIDAGAVDAGVGVAVLKCVG